MADVHIEYMALSDLLKRKHPRNPKDHDLGQIIISYQRFGYVTPGTIDERTGYFAEGHGRIDALATMKADGKQPPERIDKRADDWYLPVFRGVSFNSDLELEAFLVTANRLTLLGGWDEPTLAALLQDLAREDESLFQATGYDGEDLDALLFDLNPAFDAVSEDEQPRLDQKKPIICPHCGHEFTPND